MSKQEEGTALRLFDTKSRALVPFCPLVPGTATVYVCGPTVQAAPHIGHLRSAVVFDLLRRWLTERGLDVIFARNVTDIDDKILHEAGHAGEPWWALAERNARAFDAAYRAVGCQAPTVQPRATGHIPQMLSLTARLIAAGHAYPAGGDVYFDVHSLPSYGQLSGQRLDAMLHTESVALAKRDPLDFALWKAAKPDEPSWASPWGPGRPGWHLECSAMSTEYLGASFDIHGGGQDLVFPHHENELAQACGAGDPFARLWMHNGLVNVGSAKMSKSLGNSLLVADILQRVAPVVLRYALLTAHYRSDLDFSEETLAEAQAAWGRIDGFLRAAPQPAVGSGQRWAAFAAALDDDLSVPRALAVVHSTVRAGNTALAAGEQADAGSLAAEVRRMLDVLGLSDAAGARPAAELQPVLDGLIGLLLAERAAARGRRDFAASDRIRDELHRLGVAVEDTASGVRWHLA